MKKLLSVRRHSLLQPDSLFSACKGAGGSESGSVTAEALAGFLFVGGGGAGSDGGLLLADFSLRRLPCDIPSILHRLFARVLDLTFASTHLLLNQKRLLHQRP
jgi:hypothetical protein